MRPSIFFYWTNWGFFILLWGTSTLWAAPLWISSPFEKVDSTEHVPVFAIVPRFLIGKISENTYQIENQLLNQQAQYFENKHTTLCPYEDWNSLLSVATCSASLVSKSVLATARHCVSGRSPEELRKFCERHAFIFDWRGESELASSRIFYCNPKLDSQNQALRLSTQVDLALIYLNKEVRSVVMPELVRDLEMASDEKLFSFGHPFGMKLFVSKNGNIISDPQTPRQQMIATNLSTMRGESGGPLFLKKNDKNILAGILISNNGDFKYNEEKKCLDIINCSEKSDCLPSYFLKTDSILDILIPVRKKAKKI